MLVEAGIEAEAEGTDFGAAKLPLLAAVLREGAKLRKGVAARCGGTLLGWLFTWLS